MIALPRDYWSDQKENTLRTFKRVVSCNAKLKANNSMPKSKPILISIFGTLWISILLISFLSNYHDTIKGWQDLISGAMSLFAASITVAVMWKQMAITRGIENDRSRRHLISARFILQLWLSEMIQYVESLAEIIRGSNCKTVSGRKSTLRGKAIPQPPIHFFDRIERISRDIENENVTMRIAESVGELQVLISRLQGYSTENNLMYNLHDRENLLRQCIKIHAIISSLFKYARFETDKLEDIAESDVYNSTCGLDLHHESFSEHFEKPIRFRTSKSPPKINQ